METIGQRIRKFRKAITPALTQEALASKLGIKGSAIAQWESDKTSPSGHNLVYLAKQLKVTPEDILGIKKGSPTNLSHTQNVSILRTVPVISSVQAGEWQEAVDHCDPNNPDCWQETTAKVGGQAFALRVQGRSMQNPNGSPSIPDGAIVIVDPNAVVTHGKIVVAKLTDANQSTIKRYSSDGLEHYPEPLNPDYKPIKINENCVIIGVVRQVIQDL